MVGALVLGGVVIFALTRSSVVPVADAPTTTADVGVSIAEGVAALGQSIVGAVAGNGNGAGATVQAGSA